MFWMILSALVLIIVLWLLLAPIELNLDTRIPVLSIRWVTIAQLSLTYDHEQWEVRVQAFFFRKKWPVLQLLTPGKQKGKKTRVRKNKERKRKPSLEGVLRILRTFRIRKWQAAIDSEEVIINAWLYPLNYVPPFREHIWVNFQGKNYAALTLRNLPIRILMALIK